MNNRKTVQKRDIEVFKDISDPLINISAMSTWARMEESVRERRKGRTCPTK